MLAAPGVGVEILNHTGLQGIVMNLANQAEIVTRHTF